MACSSAITGVAIGCDNNIGGIKKMYIALKSSITYPLTLSSPGDEISGITMIGGATFQEFEFTKNSSTFEESTDSNQETGNEVTTQTITLKLNRREKTKRDALLLLGKFKDLVIIITDNNDINWLFGETNGVNLKTKAGGAGTTKQDANGYTLTFIGEEPEEANTVTAAALAAVI
jgi:hypothetical protein